MSSPPRACGSTGPRARACPTTAPRAGPSAILCGSEERGLRRLTRERCDTLFRIPMAGAVESLNVSVAAGIALFEARRQRAAGAVDPLASDSPLL